MNYATKKNIGNIIKYLYEQNIKSIEMMLTYGFNPNIILKDETALMHILNKTKYSFIDVKIVELLIKYGANVNVIDKNKNSLLEITCTRPSKTIAEMILKDKFDDKNTTQIVKLLLDNKINKEYKKKAFIAALDQDKLDIIKLLLEYKDEIQIDNLIINYDPLTFSMCRSSIKKIIIDNLKVNTLKKIISNTNDELLGTICYYGCYAAAKRLLESELCNVDNKIKIMNQNNGEIEIQPLLRVLITRNIFMKTDGDFVKIAKLIIDYGANIDGIELNDDLKSHVINIKNKLTEYLLDFFPKVLVIMIIDYIIP